MGDHSSEQEKSARITEAISAAIRAAEDPANKELAVASPRKITGDDVKAAEHQYIFPKNEKLVGDISAKYDFLGEKARNEIGKVIGQKNVDKYDAGKIGINLVKFCHEREISVGDLVVSLKKKHHLEPAVNLHNAFNELRKPQAISETPLTPQQFLESISIPANQVGKGMGPQKTVPAHH